MLLTPDEAAARLLRPQQPAVPERAAYLLTFDDGLASQFPVAREILDVHRVRAVFFVCASLIDTPRARHREVIAARIFAGRLRAADLPDGIALMSWAEVRALAAGGHAVGSHTATHQRLAGLDAAALQEEISAAAARLTAGLGVAVPWFAYPFGDLGSITTGALAVVARSHTFCCSGIRGLNSPTTHPLALRREHVDLSALPAYQEAVRDGGLDFRYTIQARQLQAMARMAEVTLPAAPSSAHSGEDL